MLSKIGQLCQEWRLKQGYTQEEIAFDLGYSQSNISFFECGKNDSLKIFLWYVLHGFVLSYTDLYLNWGND